MERTYHSSSTGLVSFKVAGSLHDLICFSDVFPTLVDAAHLPAKHINDGDGWSFWPQCEGKQGRTRDWIYCYYFPRPSSAKYNDTSTVITKSAFARNKRFKLYNNGDLFDTTTDVLEKEPLTVINPAAVILILRTHHASRSNFLVPCCRT